MTYLMVCLHVNQAQRSVWQDDGGKHCPVSMNREEEGGSSSKERKAMNDAGYCVLIFNIPLSGYTVLCSSLRYVGHPCTKDNDNRFMFGLGLLSCSQIVQSESSLILLNISRC